MHRRRRQGARDALNDDVVAQAQAEILDQVLGDDAAVGAGIDHEAERAFVVHIGFDGEPVLRIGRALDVLYRRQRRGQEARAGRGPCECRRGREGGAPADKTSAR